MNRITKMVLVPYETTLKKQSSSHVVEKLSHDLILQTIPKTYKNKARALLNYIERDIDWNNKGEIKNDGIFISGTHIADLIRYTLREYGTSPPKGYQEFIKELNALNVPTGLITQQKSFLPKQHLPTQNTWQKL